MNNSSMAIPLSMQLAVRLHCDGIGESEEVGWGIHHGDSLVEGASWSIERLLPVSGRGKGVLAAGLSGPPLS